MTFSSDSEISHIALGLIDRSLPRSEWTHAAHFAAAAWLLRQEKHDALIEMPDYIRNYNESTGTPNTDSEGYHETITIASLRAIQHILQSHPADVPLYCIVNEILESDLSDPAWLLKYWNKETLFSVLARKVWVEPDIKPLPFA